jgi:hypothetical protein
MEYLAPDTQNDGSAPTAGNEWLSQVRQVVAALDQLLQLLFGESNSLDIITYQDVLRVYRLTALGAPATAAIDKSQRIVRAQGDYRQRGLCEFHIGLIYFYWGDCRGAAQQFVIARHQWLFVNHAAAVALAYFAHGQAMFYAYHYEAARSSFGKVQRWLDRSKIAPQSEYNSQFVLELEEWLATAEEAARRILWPEDDRCRSDAADSAGAGARPAGSTEDAADARGATEAPVPPPSPATPTPQDEGLPPSAPFGVPPPIGVPPPYSNLPLTGAQERPTPAPGHRLVDERYQWCQVVGQRGDFVAGASVGAWLLVDTRVTRHRLDPGHMLVLGSDQENWGQTLVWSGTTQSAFNFYYLGRVLASGILLAETDTLPVALDDTGKIHQVTQKQIIGLFVGVWNTALA